MTPSETAAQLRLAADWIEKSMSEQPKSFTLPTPPPGMKWHREDWTAEMLPPGTRPFFLGETSVKPNHDNPTDQVGGDKWGWGTLAKGEIATADSKHLRTTRPLLFTHEGHEWTWHRAGDPMPCDGNRRVFWLYQICDEYSESTEDTASHREWDWSEIIGWRYADAEKPDEISWIEWHGGPCPLRDEEVEILEYKIVDGGQTSQDSKPSELRWPHVGSLGDIIAYRVLKWREKKPKVPLGPEDVTPFTRLRVKVQSPDYRFISWIAPLSVNQDGILVAARSNVVEISWETLKLDYERNDSLETGKWDINAWEACEK